MSDRFGEVRGHAINRLIASRGRRHRALQLRHAIAIQMNDRESLPLSIALVERQVDAALEYATAWQLSLSQSEYATFGTGRLGISEENSRNTTTPLLVNGLNDLFDYDHGNAEWVLFGVGDSGNVSSLDQADPASSFSGWPTGLTPDTGPTVGEVADPSGSTTLSPPTEPKAHEDLSVTDEALA